MNPNLVPDLAPSPVVVYKTADGKKMYQQVGEYHRAKIYDEVEVVSGALPSAAIKLFDPTKKSLLSTNVVSQAKIPAGQVLRIDRVGVDVVSIHGNTLITGADWRKVLAGFYLDIKVNKIEVAAGRLIDFPPGVGVSGQTQESGQSIVSNGIANDSAPMGQVNGTVIDNDYEIVGTLTALPRTGFASAPTGLTTPILEHAVLIYVFLDGMQFQAALINGNQV